MNELHVRVSDEGARFALDSVTFALIRKCSLTAIVSDDDARLMMHV